MKKGDRIKVTDDYEALRHIWGTAYADALVGKEFVIAEVQQDDGWVTVNVDDPYHDYYQLPPSAFSVLSDSEE